MDEKILKLLYRILFRAYKETNDYTLIYTILNSQYQIHNYHTIMYQILSFYDNNLSLKYKTKKLCNTIILLYLKNTIIEILNKSTKNPKTFSLFINEYNKQRNTNYTEEDGMLYLMLKSPWYRESLYRRVTELIDYSLYWYETSQGHDYWRNISRQYRDFILSKSCSELINSNLLKNTNS